MKNLLLAMAVVCAFSVNALADKVYVGEGTATATGTKGGAVNKYKSVRTMSCGSMIINLDFGKMTETYHLDFEFSKNHNGYFDVLSGGKVIGSGNCFNRRTHKICSYQIQEQGETLWENLYFVGKSLNVTGGMKSAGEAVEWKEKLTLK